FVLGGIATFAIMAIQINRATKEQVARAEREAARAEREVANARAEEQRAKDACEKAQRCYLEFNAALGARNKAIEATTREVLETYATAIRKHLKDPNLRPEFKKTGEALLKDAESVLNKTKP